MKITKEMLRKLIIESIQEAEIINFPGSKKPSENEPFGEPAGVEKIGGSSQYDPNDINMAKKIKIDKGDVKAEVYIVMGGARYETPSIIAITNDLNQAKIILNKAFSSREASYSDLQIYGFNFGDQNEYSSSILQSDKIIYSVRRSSREKVGDIDMSKIDHW